MRGSDLVIAIFAQPRRTIRAEFGWSLRAPGTVCENCVLCAEPGFDVVVVGAVRGFAIFESLQCNFEGVPGAIGEKVVTAVFAVGVDVVWLLLFFQELVASLDPCFDGCVVVLFRRFSFQRVEQFLLLVGSERTTVEVAVSDDQRLASETRPDDAELAVREFLKRRIARLFEHKKRLDRRWTTSSHGRNGMQHYDCRLNNRDNVI